MKTEKYSKHLASKYFLSTKNSWKSLRKLKQSFLIPLLASKNSLNMKEVNFVHDFSSQKPVQRSSNHVGGTWKVTQALVVLLCCSISYLEFNGSIPSTRDKKRALLNCEMLSTEYFQEYCAIVFSFVLYFVYQSMKILYYLKGSLDSKTLKFL